MIDVSDGLLADLATWPMPARWPSTWHRPAFPLAEPLQAVGAALGIDPMRLVLPGGDDHALAATFPPDAALPEGWRPVGTVSAGEGVTVDGSSFEGDGGHRHYR